MLSSQDNYRDPSVCHMNAPSISLVIGGLLTLAGVAAGADRDRVTGSVEAQVIPRTSYTARDGEIQSLRGRLSAFNPREFQAHEYRGANGKTIPYRLFTPSDQEAGNKYPLVLVLHGSSSRGTDNLTQIASENVAVSAGIWTLPENQKPRPCFVLAPQCPPAPDTWSRVESWGAETHSHDKEPTPVLATVLELLDEIMKENPVDPDRVYVIGASMGGFGSWDILVRRPNFFAAAVPVCGALAEGQAKSIAHMQVWIFHGAADVVVPVSGSRRAFEQLRASGGRPRYTEYMEGEHRISVYAWTEPSLMDWLFAQKRNQK
ncbi:MAG: phospholipase [Verrucomicrobiaceae bacterium]|nr:MAG: phospholipase [Verrucomicrobiaceae bacterium]